MSSPKAKWHPMARPPTDGATRVLIYCPNDPFCRIGSISVDFLPWVGATHWHPLVTPYPAPPRNRR